jgi:hypothetical protein
MHTYEVEAYRDSRWWMIRIREIDGLTQARWRGEVKSMARSYIAVSTGRQIHSIAVRIVRPCWWKLAKNRI